MSVLRDNAELYEIVGDEVVAWLGPNGHATCFPIVSDTSPVCAFVPK